MHPDELTQLRTLGLTEGEIKVYGALLRLREATKTALVKESGISPANLYDITNRLSEKGIISITERDGVKHFAPANPRQLLAFVDQKQRELEKERDTVLRILPALDALYAQPRKGITVEAFTGWRGLKAVFDDMIDECGPGDTCRVSGATEGERGRQADRFFLKYSKLRAQKGILLEVIFNESMRARKERVTFFLRSRQCSVRFLDQKTLAETMLYKDVTVILTLTENPTAIRIRGKEVTDNFLQQFKALWRIAKR